ncbi:sphingosine N-acyltransferase lag1 [Monosporozyma unispora]|nr:sphingosine N-acyltransferase lag1 [Kazachstania unispora]
MGLPIYITMDVSDLMLSLSKIFNYLDSAFTPIVLGAFIIVWIYTRHYLNLKILWSVLTEFRTVGEYRLNFAVQQYKCWISLPIVFTLIAALQLVQLYWLFLILRIVYKVATQSVYEDIRSDSDSSAEDANEDEPSDTADSLKKED